MSTPACSFCHKKQSEALQLVAVPPAYICDECAMLAVEMISIEHPDWGERLMRTLALLPKRPNQTK
jgi:ATP-dependent protease Clp ATPase subunit